MASLLIRQCARTQPASTSNCLLNKARSHAISNNKPSGSLSCNFTTTSASKNSDAVNDTTSSIPSNLLPTDKGKSVENAEFVDVFFLKKRQQQQDVEASPVFRGVNPLANSVSVLKRSPDTQANLETFLAKYAEFEKRDADRFDEDALVPEFEGDDVPEKGHLKLEEHRRKRLYNRVAAWELPALRQYATKFVKPSRDDIFQFKYATFMGQSHKAERKVTVSFKVSDVANVFFPVNNSSDQSQVDDQQKRIHKLKLLARERYNPDTDVIHMDGQNFPNSVQNKKFLVDTIKRLIIESRDISTESFADIALDTRHVKVKKVLNKDLRFPVEWNRPQDSPLYIVPEPVIK
ncbi:mitochondrial ribosomal subunit protein-domain-containing protein [Lipomyces japonicus]|uniref:mitochondrial 37S ribosomal protein mS35 n=1 Tax=Lipomyces japonicus TaxID=56871 RepID=UPI0034CD7416